MPHQDDNLSNSIILEEKPDLKSAPQKKLSGLVILVAEDDEVSQVFTATTVEKMGCKVFLAAHGQQVLDLLNIMYFDLILMDCQMPVMNGFEATNKIRSSLGKWYFKIPILALTGHLSESDVIRIYEAGMNAHLSKPIQVDSLQSAILESVA